MADIAVVFHWDLSSLSVLELDELIEWRQRATQRAEPEQ